MDICCALTGLAPHVGLHTDSGRNATLRIDVDLPDRALDSDATYPLLGYAIGGIAGTRIPVIVGLDERAHADRLKALGAAAASSGAVAMFHAIGVTPEAADLESALGGNRPMRTERIGIEQLSRARSDLTTDVSTLGAVSVGTPHMSIGEMRRLKDLFAGRQSRVPFYLNTSRSALRAAEEEGIADDLESVGATIVTDTCTYITPIIGDVQGDVMTDSAKWAHYAPANLGVEVVFGSLAECVESAVTGDFALDGDWT